MTVPRQWPAQRRGKGPRTKRQHLARVARREAERLALLVDVEWVEHEPDLCRMVRAHRRYLNALIDVFDEPTLDVWMEAA